MFTKPNLNILLFTTAILLFCVLQLQAQSKNVEIKLKLAQSYERSGDIETAVKLYEEIFSQDSTNYIIFEALKKNYLQLKRYDEAINLMKYWLTRNPNDIGVLSQIGSAYVLNSDEQKAIEFWEQAIATDPKSENTYRVVASAATLSRLLEHAIDIYKRGRKACSNPNLFTTDIAYLYSIMMNYPEATREYINLIKQNPTQLGYAQSRIASYTERAEGLSATILAVEDAIKKEADNLVFHQLLAWLYMEGKYFDRAYNVYKFIDDKMKANGGELYNFAERALKEKAFKTAINTFQEIMTKYPKFNLLAQVKYGYARALEESDEITDTLRLFGARSPFTNKTAIEARKPFVEAAEAYQRVISDYSNTEIAAHSLLRIASIQQNKFFDLDAARSSLENLVTNYSKFSLITLEGRLRLGDVYLESGNLSKAEEQYQTITRVNPNINALKEEAMLRLAELDYFNDKFQEALDKLTNLTSNPASDVTNDALSLKIFIQENLQSNEKTLKEFAKADLLKRQNKLSESLIILESILKQNSKTELYDETIITIGDILTQMNKYTEAISVYSRIAIENPESIHLDRTLMKTGQVFEFGLKDKVKAIETYQQLLEKFPLSIFAGEARKRIRELRGDTL